MDLVCTKCLEPWDMDYVLHECPEDFKKNECGAIIECPNCEGETKKSILEYYGDDEKAIEEHKTKSAMISATHDLLGDDVDGIASILEDEGLT